MNDAARPPLAYCKETLINSPAPPPPAAPPTATPVPNPPKPASPAPTAANPSKPVPPPPLGPPAPPGPKIPTGTVPVQFLVDFAGNGIENTPANQPPDLDLTLNPPGTYLREKSVEKNGYDNSWRVTFTIIPARRYVPTELRCRLIHNGKPITETWSYTWNQ
jgi:hypothetical protein